MTMQTRAESILQAQARIRALYRRGEIDGAIREYEPFRLVLCLD